MQIRLGYELIYQCPQPTPMILTLNIHYTRAADLVRTDVMLTDPWVPLVLYRDGFGNWCSRLVALPLVRGPHRTHRRVRAIRVSRPGRRERSGVPRLQHRHCARWCTRGESLEGREPHSG